MTTSLDIKTIADGFLAYLKTQKKIDLLPQIIQYLSLKVASLDRVVIESSLPLSATQKNKLTKQYNKPVTFVLNPEILGGIKIIDGDKILDLSLNNKLDNLVTNLTA